MTCKRRSKSTSGEMAGSSMSSSDLVIMSGPKSYSTKWSASK